MYFKEINSMVNRAILSHIRDSFKHLKWNMPITSVLYPTTTVPGDVDLHSFYIALRSYINSSRKGKEKEASRPSDNGHDCSIAHAVPASALWKKSESYISALQDTLHG